MARKKPRSAKRETIEHFDDLTDDFEKDSIRGANNAYLKSMKGFREDGDRLSDRDSLVARHLKGLILCPKCGSAHVAKDGFDRKKNGKVQRYICQECGKKFSSSTLSGLSSVKMDTVTLVQLIKAMSNEDYTYSEIVNSFDISEKTAIFYRFLMFSVARKSMEKVSLSGRCWGDEMYFRRNMRKDRKVSMEYVGNGSLLRGLSKDLACVCIAFDRKRHLMAAYVKDGKISLPALTGFYKGRIAKGSKLITDRDRSYRALCEKYGLVSEQHRSDSADPKDMKALKPINDLCAYIRDRFRAHRGISNRNLEDYVLWFLYMYRLKQIYGAKTYRVAAHEVILASKRHKFRDIFRSKEPKSP